MKTATLRRTCLVAAAGAIAAVAALSATALLVTAGHAASVGKSTATEVKTEPAASTEILKAQYRRVLSIPFPEHDRYTVEKAVLGKQLFFDTRLSAANLLSCASCHSPAYGWGDGQPKGIGHGMRPLARRSPTIVNAAFGKIFMWDGRASSLEEQALGPISADREMNLPIDQLIEKLKDIPGYAPRFRAAFPAEGLTSGSIAKAIATFERTVVSGPAPFDAWIEGDETAISEAAKRGFGLFNNKAACSSCHSGWNFTDDSFHDTGLADEDVGRSGIVPGVLKMEHAFKTPGLREIARRGPYMHDGSLPTLQAVLDHYKRGGIDRPSRSDQMRPRGLSQQENDDHAAFLATITSDMAPMPVPVLPR
jgi:cytochrome c peroxidase